MPIYLVKQTVDQIEGSPIVDTRLVNAKNQAQAIGHVVEASIKCAVATPDDLINCTKLGIEVETAANGKA